VLYSTRQDWLGSIKGDVLAGAVVALALIPEAIAFSIIAGVDPKVGLYASFCIAVVIAFTGGRPGMISAATGAMALLMVTLVKEHGLQYLLAASVLTGVLQIIFGYCRLGALMRFVSRSVVTGFVNALAILIFMAQLPELTDVSWPVYALTAAGLVIIYGFSTDSSDRHCAAVTVGLHCALDAILAVGPDGCKNGRRFGPVT
jgi:Sulfate permease and related transporters (MFS superfamily)